MPKHKIALLLALIIIIISLFWSGSQMGISLGKLQSFIKGLGIYAPLVFILIYTIGPVFFMPITPLSITAGVLFGPILGTIYTVVGATLGACATFLVSKYLVKDWIDEKSPMKVALIQKRVEEDGWKFIAISRVTPIFPFNVQNYVFGVTNISLETFFFTTIFSMIPGSFIYVYLGYAGKMIIGKGSGAIIQVIIAVILLIIFSFLPYIIKKTKLIIKKLKERNKCSIKL